MGGGGGGVLIGFVWLVIGSSGGFLKCEYLPENLSYYQLFRKDTYTCKVSRVTRNPRASARRPRRALRLPRFPAVRPPVLRRAVVAGFTLNGTLCSRSYKQTLTCACAKFLFAERWRWGNQEADINLRLF
jgi:hypothetical protein